MGNNHCKLSSTKGKDSETNHKNSKNTLGSADNTYTEEIPDLRDDLSAFECPEQTRTDNNTSGVNDITEAGHGYVTLTSSEPAASCTSITATVGAENRNRIARIFRLYRLALSTRPCVASFRCFKSGFDPGLSPAVAQKFAAARQLSLLFSCNRGRAGSTVSRTRTCQRAAERCITYTPANINIAWSSDGTTRIRERTAPTISSAKAARQVSQQVSQPVELDQSENSLLHTPLSTGWYVV
jgi:hypothetical protein